MCPDPGEIDWEVKTFSGDLLQLGCTETTIVLCLSRVVTFFVVLITQLPKDVWFSHVEETNQMQNTYIPGDIRAENLYLKSWYYPLSLKNTTLT